MEKSPILSEIVKTLPVAKEFNRLFKDMVYSGDPFLMTNEISYKKLLETRGIKRSPHRLASGIMCSGEISFLTYLVEYLSCFEVPVIPITCIHDGIIVISSRELTYNELQRLNEGFIEFIYCSLGVYLPITINKFK